MIRNPADGTVVEKNNCPHLGMSLRRQTVTTGKDSVGDSRAWRNPGADTIKTMMQTRKSNPRVEYRLMQSQRAKDSVSLAEKYPRLQHLTVNLAYFDSKSLSKNSELKYKVNVQHAKSVFCFVCPHGECMGGDFDLSEELAKAVAGRRKVCVGEMLCKGWHKKPKIDKSPCHILLRYKLSLDYVRS